MDFGLQPLLSDYFRSEGNHSAGTYQAEKGGFWWHKRTTYGVKQEGKV